MKQNWLFIAPFLAFSSNANAFNHPVNFDCRHATKGSLPPNNSSSFPKENSQLIFTENQLDLLNRFNEQYRFWSMVSKKSSSLSEGIALHEVVHFANQVHTKCASHLPSYEFDGEIYRLNDNFKLMPSPQVVFKELPAGDRGDRFEKYFNQNEYRNAIKFTTMIDELVAYTTGAEHEIWALENGQLKFSGTNVTSVQANYAGAFEFWTYLTEYIKIGQLKGDFSNQTSREAELLINLTDKIYLKLVELKSRHEKLTPQVRAVWSAPLDNRLTSNSFETMKSDLSKW